MSEKLPSISDMCAVNLSGSYKSSGPFGVMNYENGINQTVDHARQPILCAGITVDVILKSHSLEYKILGCPNYEAYHNLHNKIVNMIRIEHFVVMRPFMINGQYIQLSFEESYI